MLKQYRNGLLQLIQESGLNPGLFRPKFTSWEGDEAFEIGLKNSPLKFRVRNHPGNFSNFKWAYTYFEPGFHMAETSTFVDVMGLNATFSDWLQNHVKLYIKEKTEPDMWELIESQTPLINGSEMSQEDTAVFSEDEKIRIRMSINEFRILLLKDYKPSEDELKAIDARLEYLSNAVDRLNKIDWRSVAITTLMTISTTLTLDTEKGRLLFDLFKQVFSSVLQLMQ